MTSSLPDGPRAPRLVNTLGFAFRPAEWTSQQTRAFGPIFTSRGIQGTFVMTSSPAHARTVFSADPDGFDTFTKVSLSRVLGPRSVLVTSGATHKRQRRLLTPPLHGQRLRAFGRTMQAIAEAHVDALPTGRAFRAHDLTTAFTMDVIVRTVFGAREGTESDELRAILHAMLDDFAPITIFWPKLQSSWFPPWRRYERALARFDAWLGKVLADRRASGEAREDVLALLLEARYEDGSAMDDDEIRDQLVTLLLAGHETTAIALAWLLYFAHRDRAVLDRLHRELAGATREPDVLAKLPYASAVLDETMRLHPIVTDVLRVPRADFRLDDRWVVPAGVPVVVLIEGIHRDATLYPEPARFRPERFLERSFGPHEFLPFGGGNRRCLGAAFSDYEAKVFLATLLDRRELALVHKDDEPRVRRNVTMGPARGVPMITTRS